MAESNAEIAHALIKDLWSGNLEAANQHPGYWPGLHTFDYVRSAFPDLDATIKQQVVEGDSVVTHVELTGTHSGPFLGAEPTGQQGNWSVVYLDRFQDGKVVEHTADGWMDVLMAIGAIPPPA
jgi:predicted ester cyclase